MRRLYLPMIVAAFVAGCGERAATPTSLLSPGAAAHDFGTPPPPPIAGDGTGELDVFDSGDGSSTTCSGDFPITFSYEYFVNNPGHNSFLHLHINGQDVTVHQTDKKIDIHGSITGTGFTFNITDILGGSITNGDGTLPHGVSLPLSGILTTGDGTCQGNATFNANLTPHGT